MTNASNASKTKPRRSPGRSPGRSSTAASTAHSGAQSNAHSGVDRGSNRRASRTRRAQNDATRRAGDVRHDVESAIHVLDNGVDRTPLPLQKRASMIRNKMEDRGSVTGATQLENSSMFHSSILESSIGQLGATSNSIMSPRSQSQMGFLRSASSSLVSISVDRRVSSDALSSQMGASHLHVPQGTSVPMMRDDFAVADKPRTVTRDERRAWMEAKTTVLLTETPTIMLYTHQDEIIPNEKREELTQVTTRNQAYASLKEAQRTDEGTRFHEKGVWTFAVPKKSIHSSIHPPQKKNAGPLQVTTWMLNDEFAALQENEADDDNNDENEHDEEDEEEEAGMAENASEGVKENSSDATGEQSSRGALRAGVSWVFADSLLSNLRIMERAVVQNTMEELQLSYRGIKMDPEAMRIRRPEVINPAQKLAEGLIPGDGAVENDAAVAGEEAQAALAGTLPDAVPEGASVPRLRLSDDIVALWTFRSPLTRNRAVTCMAWNCKETDILAVGYSVPQSHSTINDPKSVTAGPNNIATGSKMGGMVCCWSLKNPLAPERVIWLPSDVGVSTVAFSFEYPSLLAVGDTEGGIVIYDVRKDTSVPAIKPITSSGQHTGAVWDLKWVARGKERGDFLMSISGDGRVVQWAVGKTIERIAPDLMTLKRQHGATGESAFAEGANESALNAISRGAMGKRTHNHHVSHHHHQQQQQQPPAQRRKRDALFSRQCGGMCLDVCPADGTIYIVGTEDGSIHQCNKSQTENYELDYSPHSELVYRVRWSPFSDWYFLTCSADWSSRLYRLGQATPLVTFDSPNQDAVQDVAWSYTSSATFATTTAQGSVELWSIMDSIHPRSRAQYLDNRRLSCVLFAEQEAPVVVVGDERGEVTVFRLLAPCYTTQNMIADEQEAALEEAIRKATS